MEHVDERCVFDLRKKKKVFCTRIVPAAVL
jgi:hypothetical protein